MKKKNNLIKILILVTLFIITAVSLYVLIVKKDNFDDVPILNKNEEISLNFNDRIKTLSDYDYNNLFTVGWLQVQGTSIDLPIFTTMLPIKESKKEINVDIDYGWRSSEYVYGENRMYITGHNILNVSSKPLISNENLSDFEELMSFVYFDFAEKNLYIKYTTEEKEDIYMIYAVGFYNYSEDFGGSIEDKEELNNYINNVRKRSIYDYNVNVDNNDDIISITTCTRFFGLNSKNLFKIDARKIRSNEKIYKYDVKENDNYKEIIKKINEDVT